MSLPLPLFIGLRYVRARTSQFFVSFMSWISMLGICVGVAALITILSVMNGFEDELRSRLLSLAAHARLSDGPQGLAEWPKLIEHAREVKGVVGAAPYVELHGLLAHEPELQPALIRGIDPASESSVSTVSTSLVSGDLGSLRAGERNIVLGRVLAYQLSLGIGDGVTVMVPVANPVTGELSPRIQRFTVSGRDAGPLRARYRISHVLVAPGDFRAHGLRAPEDLERRPGFRRLYSDAVGLRVSALE